MMRCICGPDSTKLAHTTYLLLPSLYVIHHHHHHHHHHTGARLRHGISFWSRAAESAVGHREVTSASNFWKRVSSDHSDLVSLVDQHPEVGMYVCMYVCMYVRTS